VPVTTLAHATRTDKNDIQKVVTAVLDNELLTIKSRRWHRSFPAMRLNPLWNWKRKDTLEWIDKKKKDYLKYRGLSTDRSDEQDDDGGDSDDSESTE